MDTSVEDKYGEHERIRVRVETSEHSFTGYIYKPVRDEALGISRLSDHLNAYGKAFLSLTDVEVADRGKGDPDGVKVPFVAVSLSGISYIAPLEEVT